MVPDPEGGQEFQKESWVREMGCDMVRQELEENHTYEGILHQLVGESRKAFQKRWCWVEFWRLNRSEPDKGIWVYIISCFSHVRLYKPKECSPPGSSVRGILQARILEWVAMPSSRGSSRPRDRTRISCLLHWQMGSLPLAPPGKDLTLREGRTFKAKQKLTEFWKNYSSLYQIWILQMLNAVQLGSPASQHRLTPLVTWVSSLVYIHNVLFPIPTRCPLAWENGESWHSQVTLTRKGRK